MKMKKLLYVTFIIIMFCIINPIRADDEENLGDQSTRAAEEVVLDEVMAECNKSFIIAMSYIEALNETGSFPDESDKTPKCYVRCVMENTGVMSSGGVFDPERVAIIFTGQRSGTVMSDVQSMAILCAERTETCKCEKAYNFMKCLMTNEIEKYEKKDKKS